VGGEPLPDVLWRRSASGGNMPLGECTYIVFYDAHFSMNLNAMHNLM
jgi:hypothetical protein